MNHTIFVLILLNVAMGAMGCGGLWSCFINIFKGDSPEACEAYPAVFKEDCIKCSNECIKKTPRRGEVHNGGLDNCILICMNKVVADAKRNGLNVTDLLSNLTVEDLYKHNIYTNGYPVKFVESQ